MATRRRAVEGALLHEHESILRDQVINGNSPGTVLRDCETMLEFVGEDGVKTSGKNCLFPMTALAELNSLLSKSTKCCLKRPRQQSFPYVDGLYLVLRTAVLLWPEGGRRLARDAEILDSWRSLNPTEKYFDLLELWLLHASPQTIGVRRLRDTEALYECRSFLRRLPPGGWDLDRTSDEQRTINYLVGAYNLALMDLFGIASVTLDDPEPGQAWCFRHVELTTWGDALLRLISPDDSFLDALGAGRSTLDDSPFAYGFWQPRLQPFFPDYRDHLLVPTVEFQEGVHVFKVSLGTVWRRIAASAGMTLDDLAHAILGAYQFDPDHLYAFYFRDRMGRTIEAMGPEAPDELLTIEIEIGTMELSPGDSFDFLFDFGDQWRFKIKLERIDADDESLTRPRLLESHGESPPQYAACEEID